MSAWLKFEYSFWFKKFFHIPGDPILLPGKDHFFYFELNYLGKLNEQEKNITWIFIHFLFKLIIDSMLKETQSNINYEWKMCSTTILKAETDKNPDISHIFNIPHFSVYLLDN